MEDDDDDDDDGDYNDAEMDGASAQTFLRHLLPMLVPRVDTSHWPQLTGADFPPLANEFAWAVATRAAVAEAVRPGRVAGGVSATV